MNVPMLKSRQVDPGLVIFTTEIKILESFKKQFGPKRNIYGYGF